MKIEEKRRLIAGKCERCWQVWTWWDLCPWCENGYRNAYLAERVKVRDLVELRRAA